MNYRNLTWLVLAVVIILLDQFSKYFVVLHLTFEQAVIVIPHWFNLFLTHNPGASFSFLADMNGWQRWFLSAASIIISLILLKWLLSLAKNQYWLAIAISLILGGAMGNLIDRLRLSYVIDFIQVYYKNHYFPTFNIADSAVVVGTAMLICYSLCKKETGDE
jgi:signal peptidase II